MMSAPDVRARLRAIQGRGGRVVVVDPRRTETARIADAHHFMRPGTDALLLAALVSDPRARAVEVVRWVGVEPGELVGRLEEGAAG